jgi:segregation and condensation protein B
MIKDKEKEQAEKMKALRRELEDKLEEQLPPEMMDEKMQVEVQRINENEPLEPARAKQVIEALLFASAKPLTAGEIRRVMKFLTPKEIEGMVAELKEEYTRDNRSFEIVEIAGGFEIATKKEFAPWIFKIELQKKAKQVTQSALETLSILAYKQPITKAEIEDLRGVDAGGVIATLTERGLIKIVGKKEVPGRPFLYGTTEKFLEHFGLKALSELPNIDEIKNLVEKSVKKEELLGTQKMVDIPQEEAVSEGSAEVAVEEISVEIREEIVQEETANEDQDESQSTAS